jgi:quinol monooxygenase YgiN
MSKVFLFVEIDVQPGKSADFIEKLRIQADVIRGESGCEFIDIYQNSDNDNVVNVWEIWSDRGSWDAHMNNSSSAAWREIAAGFVIGEKITVMHQA